MNDWLRIAFEVLKVILDRLDLQQGHVLVPLALHALGLTHDLKDADQKLLPADDRATAADALVRSGVNAMNKARAEAVDTKPLDDLHAAFKAAILTADAVHDGVQAMSSPQDVAVVSGPPKPTGRL